MIHLFSKFQKQAILLSILFCLSATIGEAQSVTNFLSSSLFVSLNGSPYLATDQSGNIFVSNYSNNIIYKVTPSGNISTFANISSPRGIVFDKSGNLYVNTGNSINKITPSGSVSTLVSGLYLDDVGNLVMDAAGNFYAVEKFYNIILKITQNGVVTTFANAPSVGFYIGLAFDGSGNLFAADYTVGNVVKISPSGNVSTFLNNGTFSSPSCITYNASNGNLYISTNSNSNIYQVTPSGSVSTYSTVTVADPYLVSNASGNFYVVGYDNPSMFEIVLPPIINSFTPTSADIGATVTLNGSRFFGTTSVKFGGVAAQSFSVNSDNSISAVVPKNAVSGNVSVTTIAGTTSLVGFTFIPPPVITSFTPTTAAIGTSVTINGTGFTGNMTVSFGGVAAAIVSVSSPTKIIATVPALAESGSISVSRNGNVSSMAGFKTGPSVLSFSPIAASAGTTITIKGTNLLDVSSVSFYSTFLGNSHFLSYYPTTATPIIINDSLLTVTVPNGIDCDSVTLTNNSGIASLKGFVSCDGQKANFLRGQAAVVNPVVVWNGQTVIQNYTSGNLASFLILSCYGPNYFTDYHNVKYTQYNVPSNSTISSLPGSYSQPLYYPSTTVQSIQWTINGVNVPDISLPGVTVTQQNNYYQGSPAAILKNIKVTDSMILNLQVSYTNSCDITSNLNTRIIYRLLPPPTITSISNTILYSGQTIYIKGVGFLGGNAGCGSVTAVLFGDPVPATSFTVLNDSTISAVIPPSTNGNVSGNIQVVTTYGTAVSPVGFILNSPPTIASFLPKIAGMDSAVTILGTNLTTTTRVSFGGVESNSFKIINDDSIIAVVPKGAASGKITITSTFGSDSIVGFTFVPSPKITGFTPTSVLAGTWDTISGTHFTTTTEVTFGDSKSTTFNVLNDSTIAAFIPTSSITGNIVVKTLGGIDSIIGFSVLPNVISFSPIEAGRGTTITINGTGFSEINSISFGGVEASSFSLINSNVINAVVANGASGSVSITTNAGTSTLPGFIFVAAPTITSFTPTNTTTDSIVTITGTNFTGASAVRFGGTAATSFSVVNSTTITAVVGYGTSGNVSVTTVGGITFLGGFNYHLPIPNITSFTPTIVGTGATVTINGTGFIGATAVSFGGVSASSFTVVSATQITAVVTSGATSGNVNVTTGGGTANKAGFTFVAAPTITSFTPTAATTDSTVTITGTNFSNVTDVSFGGSAATHFSVINSTTITAVIGSGASGKVSITTVGGTINLAGFTFLNPPPAITSFAPTSATTFATITITGKNLTGATAVSIGGTTAYSFKIINSTTITAVVAGGSSGSINVTSADGTGTKSGFTFVPLPNYTWLGNTSTAWSIASNWSNGILPTSSSTVTIPSYPTNQPILGAEVTINGIINSGTLSLNGHTLTLTGTVTGAGTLVGSTTSSLTIDGTVGSIKFSVNNNLKNLTINSGSVTLGSALNVVGSFTPKGGTFNTGGLLTLKSTSVASTAVVGQVGGTVSGKVTVERFIPQGLRVYHDLAPEVTNAGSVFNSWQESGDTTNGYGIFITGISGASPGYDPSTGLDITEKGSGSLEIFSNAWNWATNTKNLQLDVFKSFRVLTRGNRGGNMFAATQPSTMWSDATLRATGNLVTGTVTYNTTNASSTSGFTSTAAKLNGGLTDFSIVANPYVNQINWDSIYTRSQGINNTYYYLDPTFVDGSGFNTYITYNASYHANSNPSASHVGKYIQPGQGFFVQNDGSGTSPQVIIQESDKDATSPLTSTFGTNTINRIAISLWKNNCNIDGAVAVFNSGYSKSLVKEDSRKINNVGENLYFSVSNTTLSIKGLPLPVAKDSIQLQLSNTKANTAYQLKIDASLFNTNNTTAYLKDNYLNKQTLIGADSTVINFTTTTDASSYQNRFTILFGASTLPVSGIHLTATATPNSTVSLNWSNANDKALVSYTIEHSSDGVSFATIASVNSASYVDNQASEGINYYRIKATDNNRSITYSTVVSVTIGAANSELSIYPNPIEGGKFNLRLNTPATGSYKLKVFDLAGKLVYSKAVLHNAATTVEAIDLGKKLSSGIYTIKVVGVNGISYQTNVVK